MVVRLWVLGIIFVLLNITVTHHLAIKEIPLNLVVIFLVYVGLFYERMGKWLGFGLGVILDLYSQNMGYNTLVGTLIGHGVEMVGKRMYKELPVLWLILLIGGTILHMGVIFSANYGIRGYFWVRYILPSGIYTGIVGIVGFYLIRKKYGFRV
jgi:rod shape-determining protein MreD